MESVADRGRAEHEGAINSDEGAIEGPDKERCADEEKSGAMTEGVGVAQPATEPARKADKANGAPIATQTVGMNDRKDTDPPEREDGAVEAAE